LRALLNAICLLLRPYEVAEGELVPVSIGELKLARLKIPSRALRASNFAIRARNNTSLAEYGNSSE
jgi:hypothetical protein